MKTICLLLIFSGLIIFNVLSCTNNNSTKPDSNTTPDDKAVQKYKSLIGDWEWVNSSGGLHGDIVTPQKVGFSVIISFDDSKNYKVYLNDSLYESGTVALEWTKQPYRQDSAWVLTKTVTFNNGGMIPYANMVDVQVLTNAGNDTISFIPPGADRYNPLYVRKIVNNSEKYKSLIGNWQWLNSTGGIAGTTITPKKVGYNINLKFDDFNNYQVFRNDTLYEFGKVVLEWTKHPYNKDSVWLLTKSKIYNNGGMIPYGNIEDIQVLHDSGKDSITFLPPGADFYNPLYVKKGD